MRETGTEREREKEITDGRKEKSNGERKKEKQRIHFISIIS